MKRKLKLNIPEKAPKFYV